MLRTRRTLPPSHDFSTMPTIPTKRIGRRPSSKGKEQRKWKLTGHTMTTVIGVTAAVVVSFTAALLVTVAVIAGYKTYFRVLIKMAKKTLVDDTQVFLTWLLKRKH